VDAVFAESHSYANRTLTGYLSGRAAHIELFEHDWWRANVDEFKIGFDVRSRVSVAKGVFLPAAASAARVRLRAGSRDTEVAGTSATPRLAKLFPGNPRAAMSGFRLVFMATDEAQLFGGSDGFEDRLIGIVKASTRRTPPAGGRAAAGQAAP
jgi:hypothetical protein